MKVASRWIIANIASDDALILPHRANPAGLNFRQRQGCPWQNPYVERLIGSIRRECLDYLVVINEGHLRRILAAYAYYYNDARTHLALNKNTPAERVVQRAGSITRVPHLGGLHHSFVRI
jgi:Integrase core domain